MIISVINATMLCRQEVQDKIRAVNRQLQDDFRRYWHADVHLRLEGWTGEAPDPRRPLNMRGDAVIYLWDGDKTARALGYHGLTARGVPYGVVFRTTHTFSAANAVSSMRSPPSRSRLRVSPMHPMAVYAGWGETSSTRAARNLTPGRSSNATCRKRGNWSRPPTSGLERVSSSDTPTAALSSTARWTWAECASTSTGTGSRETTIRVPAMLSLTASTVSPRPASS